MYSFSLYRCRHRQRLALATTWLDLLVAASAVAIGKIRYRGTTAQAQRKLDGQTK